MSSESNERLAQIRTELAAILEARITELMTAMRDSEQVTRQIVTTDMDIGRYRHLRESLDAELGGIKEEMDALVLRTEEVREQHARLRKERDRLRDDLHGNERAVREADADVESLRQKLGSLSSEAESLQAENVDLKTRIRTLEENVARMRKLKEELMSSISGLTAQMAGLTNLDTGGR